MTYMQRAQLWLTCIQQGFVTLLPILFLGALALTFIQIPVYFPQFDGMSVFNIGQFIVYATNGLISLFLVCSVSYELAKAYKTSFDLRIEPLAVSIIAGATLIVMLYISGAVDLYSNFGFENLITGILVAIIFTELFIFWVRYISVKSSYLEHEIHGGISASVRMIIPAVILPIVMITVYCVLFIDASFTQSTVLWLVGDIDPSHGLSIWQAIKTIIINQLVWFVGIHGTSVIGTAQSIIFSNVNADNFMPDMLSHFAYLGGSGCTLGLVITLLFSKQKNNRQFARYAIVPSLFNINELIIYGLPIVFNRYFFIPFLLMPILAMVLTFFAVSAGLVNFNHHDIPWSMPFLLGGFLLTGHWSGALMQLIICIISALVYRPFVIRYDISQSIKNAGKINNLIKTMEHPNFDIQQAMRRPDEEGIFCRRIAMDLASQENLELYYQPKSDHNGNVVGAEALIRWHHPSFGNIPPSIFIPVAEENKSIHSLGLWIIERCFQDMNKMKNQQTPIDIPIAINVSPIQLLDINFIDNVQKLISQYDITPTKIELELTEGHKLCVSDQLLKDLKTLNSIGIGIAVDDFGMGHTSLHYLKSFSVQTIKIDGSIIKDVSHSVLVQKIIQSMGQLAHEMNAALVAEWVEDESQLQALHKIGCDQYQGYLFSMALPLTDFMTYYLKHPKKIKR